MKKKVLFYTVIPAVITTLAITAFCKADTNIAEAKNDSIIKDNVTIAGVDVSGMTKEEADEALQQALADYGEEEIKLKAGEKEIVITPKDAGFSIANADVTQKAVLYGNTGNLLQRYRDEKDISAGKEKNFDLAYTADAQMIENFLTEKKSEIETKAVDGSLKHENGQFSFVAGKPGISVKTSESVAAIKNYLENEFPNGAEKEIDLVVEETKPRGTEEELSQVKDLLGSFSTDFSTSSAGRAQNVKNGASKVNGHLIYPGDTFSVGDAIHPCTVENGYTIAMAYENGQSVESVGGGICQVSTTMYNAVIRAELEVVTRAAHSMTVSYVKPSMDAAISDGSKDFKFRNNQEYPVYIEMYTGGGIIYANVYGKETRPANRKVTFESEILETTEPQTIISADSSQPIGTVTRTSGSPHTGYKARLLKIVTVDGVEQSRKVYNNSVYRATNATYSVGTASSNPEAVAQINAAIATNDINTIKATAAQWSDSAIASRASETAQQPAESESAPAGGDASAGETGGQ